MFPGQMFESKITDSLDTTGWPRETFLIEEGNIVICVSFEKKIDNKNFGNDVWIFYSINHQKYFGWVKSNIKGFLDRFEDIDRDLIDEIS